MTIIQKRNFTMCSVFFFCLFYNFIYLSVYLFIYSCAGSSFVTCRFSLVGSSGHHCSLQRWASHCCGLSCCRAHSLQARRLQQLWHMGSLVVMGLVALRHAESSWTRDGPGIEPVSPALAVGFLTTVPPGKSYSVCETKIYHIQLQVFFNTNFYM